MKVVLLSVLLLAVTLPAVPEAQAAGCAFVDNFNSENGGSGALNYYGLANWAVTAGSIDLIGNGYYDFYPGNGLYIDLDGSTGQAGTMTSTPIALAPGTYTLNFDLGGNARGAGDDTVHVSFMGTSQTYTVPSSQPLTPETIVVTIGSAQTDSIVIHNDGGDNMGALLDNVSVCGSPPAPLPELPTFALVGAGLVGIAGVMIVRRK